MEERTCKGPCGKSLPAIEEHFYFRKSSKNGKLYASPYCRLCEKARASVSRKSRYMTADGKAVIDAQNKEFRDRHPEVAESKRIRQNALYRDDGAFREAEKTRSRKWRVANSARRKQLGAAWFQKNKARLREEWNERFRSDPAFRLRNNLRHAIWEALRFAGGSKGGRSILAHLPYSMESLKAHLESLWEPWMSWENYGVLDPATRTWQIDHVTPQAQLPFADFSDANFVRCWTLSNLRPLESSKNLEKGCRLS